MAEQNLALVLVFIEPVEQTLALAWVLGPLHELYRGSDIRQC